MSWQQYIDESLLGTKNIDQAAIYSVDNMGKWAGSPGFEVSATELADFVKAYGDSAEPKSIQGSGFHVAGVKYITVKADDRSIYGMKGKEGIIAVRGKQAMIVAHYPNTVAAGNAATVVENLVDYLIKAGY